MRMILAALALLFSVAGAAAGPPPLFLYPLAGHQTDGSAILSPHTVDLEQITSKVPSIAPVEGVVLIVYWSQLCPERTRCDFQMIDQAIDYWRQRNKRVVLDVATIGYPMKTRDGARGATPDWVLKEIHTYSIPAKFLDKGRPEATAVMPDFSDQRFVADVGDLVRQLRRYDGNPTLSQIRIATGLMGEDNTLMGPVGAARAGLTEAQWLGYTRKIAELYYAAFHRTELEFDISRLPWMAAKGTAADRTAVAQFLNELLAHHVFLAFDGLSADCLPLLQRPDPRNGVSQSLQYLIDYKRRGGRIGLEAYEHVMAPSMRNANALAAVVARIRPDRLVLFSDAQMMQKGDRKRDDVGRQWSEVLAALGYN